MLVLRRERNVDSLVELVMLDVRLDSMLLLAEVALSVIRLLLGGFIGWKFSSSSAREKAVELVRLKDIYIHQALLLTSLASPEVLVLERWTTGAAAVATLVRFFDSQVRSLVFRHTSALELHCC